ncbi:MAG: hypothetical protein ACLP29_07070 [Dissulfurispiraceae bacterium]
MQSSPDIIYRQAVPSDYGGIIALQKENLIGNLSQEEAKDGFLSIEMDEWQFDEINRDIGIAVAVAGHEILGYLCGTSYSYSLQFPILRTMLGKLHELAFDKKPLTAGNTFIYGPVCIARSARGNGILIGLYEQLKLIAAPHYSFCLLFISDGNKRSFNAHLKLGMKPLGMFEFNKGHFYILGAALQGLILRSK